MRVESHPKYVEMRKLIAIVAGQYDVSDVAVMGRTDSWVKFVGIYLVKQHFTITDVQLSQLFNIGVDYMLHKLAVLGPHLGVSDKERAEVLKVPLAIYNNINQVEERYA